MGNDFSNRTFQPLQQGGLSWLTLLVSSSTLICCALPILLVSLGFGATVASLTSSLPVLVTMAENKEWLLFVSLALLVSTGWLLWGRAQQCPGDPTLARRCARAGVWNRRVFWVAGMIWLLGFSSAYLLLPARNFIGI